MISVSGNTLYTSLCTRSHLLGAAVPEYLAILRLPGPQWAGESVAECAGLPTRSVVESRFAVASNGLLLREEVGLLLSQRQWWSLEGRSES